MQTTAFLTVNKRGSVRLTKRAPDLYAGEVAIRLSVSVPDAAFRTPFAEAHIEVPEGFVIKPEIEVWLEPIETEAT